MKEKPDQRSYVLKVLARTGWNQTELAKRAGLDPSTLSRFLGATPTGQTLRPTTLQRIAQVTGLSFSDDDPAQQPPGFSETEAQPLPGGSTPLLDSLLHHARATGAAVDAWQLHSRALELAGYRPGDILLVSLGVAALTGDVVCAQIYDWSANRTETVFRLFDPPYLVSATADAALFKPFALDDDRVTVKGVVLHALRNRTPNL